MPEQTAPCPTCHGAAGWWDRSHDLHDGRPWVDCQTCSGSGRVPAPQITAVDQGTLRFERVTNFVSGLCWDVYVLSRGKHLGRVWMGDSEASFWPNAGTGVSLTAPLLVEIAQFCSTRGLAT